MIRNVLIIGAGDSAAELLDHLVQTKLVSLNKNKLFVYDTKLKNRFVLLNLFKKINFINDINKIPLKIGLKAIISNGDPLVREKYFKILSKKKIGMFSLIHPNSTISKTAKIGKGVVIYPQTVVGPFANIKDNVFINCGSVIGHHSEIGQNSVISPNSFMGGNSKLGINCFMGANSNIYPGVRVGKRSKLTSGSSLNTNIKESCLAHGNPAKPKFFDF